MAKRLLRETHIDHDDSDDEWLQLEQSCVEAGVEASPECVNERRLQSETDIEEKVREALRRTVRRRLKQSNEEKPEEDGDDNLGFDDADDFWNNVFWKRIPEFVNERWPQSFGEMFAKVRGIPFPGGEKHDSHVDPKQ